MLKVLIRVAGDAALTALLLFISAGTVAWWRGWVLVGVLLVVRGVTVIDVYRVNPELLRERARLPVHRDQPSTDKALVLGIMATGFLGLPVIAGLDVFHWHLLPSPAPLLTALGLVFYTLGWGIKGLVLRQNRFATSVVRRQRERGHEVVDTGLYSVVRHPLSAATPMVLAGMGLWLESSVAALCAVVPTAIVVVRILLEERFLRRELPGYGEYMTRVRRRLLPGIW
jgi:protein-S-isoprenylcysteine O-methyltransferase Ste14